MIELDIDSNPSATIVAGQFESWGLNIRSFREPLKRSVQQVAAPSFQRNFAVGGRPKWAPLSPDTIRKKAAKGQSEDTLVASGKLRTVAGQLNIWRIDGNSAQVTDLPGASYGFVHQNGFAPHIPQREFLTLQLEDQERIEEVFGDWVVERALKAGIFGRMS